MVVVIALNEHHNNDGNLEKDVQKDLPGLDDWETIGDEHFDNKRYKDAIHAYTNGIEGGDNSIDTIAKRSCAYLKVSDYKRALADAESVLIIDKTHIKCIYRKVKALFGMALYRDAMKFLENLSLDSYSQDEKETIIYLMTEGERFIAQSEKGDYPWGEIYKNNLIDLAEYTGPVVIKEAPMKGRGLFATKAIEAGELVLANKAFAYVRDSFPSKKRLQMTYSQNYAPKEYIDFLANINQILKHNPEKHVMIGSLYAGPELGFLNPKEVESGSIYVNMKRIEYICTYNAISNQGEGGSLVRNLGIWIIPSYINHSCVDANCAWLVIGDFFFLRAVNNISEGEEISIAYKAPDALIAQSYLNKYGFSCHCRLCERDRMDNDLILAKRSTTLLKLVQSLKNYISYNKFHKTYDVQINILIQLLDQSRRDAPELNFCLVQPLLDFAKQCFKINKFMKSGIAFKKVYYLTKNIAPYNFLNFVACLHVVLSFLKANETRAALSWVKILEKDTILTFGSSESVDIHNIHIIFQN